MNRYRSIVFLLAGLLGGCTTVSPQEDPIVLKLTELESRLVRVERVLDNQSLLDLANELERTRAEVRSLRGEVESVQNATQGQGERQRNLYVDLDSRLGALEGRSAAGSAASTTGGGLPAIGGNNEQGAYQAAFELLKARRYSEAAQGFEQFLVDNPESNRAGNAQYWLGEAHYVMRDFERALSEFERVATNYPGSSKVPDAQLKVGYCNYELSRWPQARTALSATIEEFPDTTAASLARQRLDQLTKEGH